MTLHDLSAQIQSFLALPSSKVNPGETIFVVSFGFWEVYHFASLEYENSVAAIDDSMDEFFRQLDILYYHSQHGLEHSSSFRVVLPKLFDPTLLPGWLSQRPVPLSPHTISEQQKNAIYLTNRWNVGIENRIGEWINTPQIVITNTSLEQEQPEAFNKDVLYYDLPTFLLGQIVEQSLQDSGLHDASGLGKGSTPFRDVYLPCITDLEEGLINTPDFVEVDGRLVCKEPRGYLWWDDWRLGPTANEAIGESVAGMLIDQDVIRKNRKGSGNEA